VNIRCLSARHFRWKDEQKMRNQITVAPPETIALDAQWMSSTDHLKSLKTISSTMDNVDINSVNYTFSLWDLGCWGEEFERLLFPDDQKVPIYPFVPTLFSDSGEFGTFGPLFGIRTIQICPSST
jgi:hypothetical protein